MKETLYIQIQKSIHIDKPTLYVSDIGELFCQDKTIENEISHIVLKNLKDKKYVPVFVFLIFFFPYATLALEICQAFVLSVSAFFPDNTEDK